LKSFVRVEGKKKAFANVKMGRRRIDCSPEGQQSGRETRKVSFAERLTGKHAADNRDAKSDGDAE
jgi:hypothetical protein